MQYEHFLPLLFLLCNSLRDLRRHEILLWTIPLFGLAGFLIRFHDLLSGPLPALLSLLPAAGFLTLSIASHGAVGMGDGLILLVLGLYYRPADMFGILLSGLTAAGAGALLLFVFRRLKEDDTLPFIPFLFTGLIFYALISR